MSREIKFRIWNNKNKEWLGASDDDVLTYYGFHLVGEVMTVQSPPQWALNDGNIVEQYTGLTDKNGKDIYEGDIMRYDAIDYQVLWEDYYAGFETKRLNSSWNNAGLTLHYLASVGSVIGNIHEDKDLLGGEDD